MPDIKCMRIFSLDSFLLTHGITKFIATEVILVFLVIMIIWRHFLLLARQLVCCTFRIIFPSVWIRKKMRSSRKIYFVIKRTNKQLPIGENSTSLYNTVHTTIITWLLFNKTIESFTTIGPSSYLQHTFITCLNTNSCTRVHTRFL